MLFARGRYCFYNNEIPKYDAGKDYYRVLGVSKGSMEADIKKEYYRLAKQYHPDYQPGFESKFKEINEAYTVLSDAKVRKQYDSARVMSAFSQKMGSKANQGNMNYN